MTNELQRAHSPAFCLYDQNSQRCSAVRFHAVLVNSKLYPGIGHSHNTGHAHKHATTILLMASHFQSRFSSYDDSNMGICQLSRFFFELLDVAKVTFTPYAYFLDHVIKLGLLQAMLVR